LGTGQIQIRVGDITQLDFRPGAIVNAANEQLAEGGGVCGAIHKAAGPGLEQEAQARHGSCPTGQAVATGAYKLNADFIIHAVGPKYWDGSRGEAKLLASAYASAIKLADDLGLESIVFPSISTGIYGFPIQSAAKVAIQAIDQAMAEAKTVKYIYLCCFSQGDARHYLDALDVLDA
jgi:O-acetyl-ADP-ribose deacetylase (regulator of RNase III)